MKVKQTQARKIIAYIKEHQGCGNRALFRFSNAPWARLHEATDRFGVLNDDPSSFLERRYVYVNSRDQVEYYVRKLKEASWL